ncbi:MAG TPA: hypothetical protein VFG69_17940 [Nannocystaceae bacterium]|nr:hypothetical protein [Nannocystaceae bacterium]
MNGFAKFKLGVAVVALLGVGVFFLWLKFKPRAPLGGACTAAIDCVEGTEYCLSPVAGGSGVCTKMCRIDADCGGDLVCKETAIVETSVRGSDVSSHEFTTGYCFAR